MRSTLVLLLGISLPASAQSLEPGEWELTATTTSRLFAKPQTSTFKRCVTKEDADNPHELMGREANRTDCTITQGPKNGDTMTWEFACAKANLRGTGTAIVRGESLESEMQTSMEVQGQRLQLSTRTTGRRLGACQS